MKILTAQSQRMLGYAMQYPNEDISATVLNSAAAGDKVYVSSFSRRVHECRKFMQSIGGDFILSVDKWNGKQRHTWYRLIPPTTT